MKALKVKDVMTAHPAMIQPTQMVKDAAKRMKQINCGVLPVGDADKVIGMITDRDITLRVTAEGKDPAKTTVQEIMTRQVHRCEEDDGIETAADLMREHDVARLLVTKGKKATGIVTMVELLRAKGDTQQGGRVLHELTRAKHATAMPAPKMATAGGGCESCE